MKQSEFLRYLKSKGVIVEQGSRHAKLFYKGNVSVAPRHPSKELSESTRKAI
jgi:mRNA interferase HicA